MPKGDFFYRFLLTIRYVRALGMFYLRLTGRPKDIYENIEKIYTDSRKVIFRTNSGGSSAFNHSEYQVWFMDQFADDLINQEILFDIALPRIPLREVLEENEEIEPRKR